MKWLKPSPYLSLALPLLASSMLWCPKLHAEFDLFNHEERITKLGIKRMVKKSADKTVITYSDSNGEKTVFEWGQDGDQASIYTYNNKGAYIEEQHRQGDFIEWINYPNRTKVKITTLDLRHVLWQTWHRSDDGWKLVAQKEVLRDVLTKTAMDEYNACNTGISDKQLDRRLRDLNNIIPVRIGGSFSDEWIPGRPNLRVREDCAKDYPGGVHTLGTDLKEGFNHGLACMDRLVQENKESEDPVRRARAAEIRRMMRKVMGNFDPAAPKPFSIRCATAGHVFGEFDVGSNTMMRAELCDRFGSHDAPAITINSAHINATLGARANHAKLQEYFFHELMHHTGFVHDHGVGDTHFDMVYAVQRGCFQETHCEPLMTMQQGQAYTVRRGTTVPSE